jgi:tRNA1Val (adenine37-N6)-methyltransferase
MSWTFLDNQRRHTQDGCQLAILMKNEPKGKFLKAIDVGCGDGIIIHEMIRLNKASKFVGIDISKHAIESATKNLKMEAMEVHLHKVSAVQFFKRKAHWDTFDRFVINPPFFKSGSGPKNKNNFDQVARHEGSLNLKVWVTGARKLLKMGGELYCVFPSERLAECLSVLSRNKVEPKEIWWLKADKRKRRFFLRAVRGAKPGMLLNL